MFVKYIEQDWYIEEPEFYEEELKEVCEKLECKFEDIWTINSDDDYELIEEITNNSDSSGPFYHYKGIELYSIYYDGGLLAMFSKKELN